jgi:hypothetical protein
MPVLTFIRELAIATFSQMASLFLGAFLFGLLINFISHLTFNSIEKAFWRKGTYIVAWLGTPVHELGHALFCLLFFHRIVGISLFRPDPVTGNLGYVLHKWNRRNPWAVLGNVFIAVGPILFGSAVLFGLFYLLIPGSSQAWQSILAAVQQVKDVHALGSYPAVIKSSALTLVGSIFNLANLGSWKFWLFGYLSICVASNMGLSLPDVKGSFSGVWLLIALFLVINLVLLLTGLDSAGFFRFMAPLLGAAYSLLILALLMVSLGFVLVYLLSAVYLRIFRRTMLNPF